MAKDQRASEVDKAKKDGSGGNIGGNGGDKGSEVIPLKFSSLFAAIVDAWTRLRGMVPATLTDVFNFTLRQYE